MKSSITNSSQCFECHRWFNELQGERIYNGNFICIDCLNRRYPFTVMRHIDDLELENKDWEDCRT